MAQIKLLPSLAYLQACFFYSRTTGELIWLERPREHFRDVRTWHRCNTMYAGKEAGAIGKMGYRVVLLRPTRYSVHRIAWKLVTGEEPPPSIDHANGDRLDNRWANLRAATHSQQSGNRRLHRVNTSGYRGVSPHQGGKWIAKLGRCYLGLFDTPEAAYAAYTVAAKQHFGKFFVS